MCGPVAIASVGLALSAVGTGVAYYQQDQNVKGQNRFNQQMADQGSQLANDSFKNQANATNLRIQQEQEAAGQQTFQNDKRAAQAIAESRVSSGEAGVSGVSVDSLFADFKRQQGTYDDAVNQNLGFTTQQLTSSLKGDQAQAEGRIAGLRRPGINEPSYLAAGVQFAGQGLDTYRQYKFDETHNTYG